MLRAARTLRSFALPLTVCCSLDSATSSRALLDAYLYLYVRDPYHPRHHHHETFRARSTLMRIANKQQPQLQMRPSQTGRQTRVSPILLLLNLPAISQVPSAPLGRISIYRLSHNFLQTCMSAQARELLIFPLQLQRQQQHQLALALLQKRTTPRGPLNFITNGQH